MGFTYVLLLSTLGLAIHTQAQNCSRPEPGRNMQLKDNDLQTFPNGATVSFTCVFGYVNAGGSTSITCNAGNWTTLRMICDKYNCGAAEEVPFGSIEYTEGTEFGNKLVVTCNTGYTLVGKRENFCGAQGWMSRMPECEVVVCLKLLSNAHATFSPIKDTYEYQDVIRYTCPNDDVLSGSTTSSCSEDGTFKPAPPTCVTVQCEEPIIDNGNWIEGSRPPHKYKATVTFECKSGYTMAGKSTQICEIDSQWSPELPTCQSIQCEEPKIQNAELVGGSQAPYKYESMVTFKCTSGYTLTGSPTQTCGRDRKWLPGLPKCQLTPTTRRPSTTKETIVDRGPTDSPGNNGNAKAIGLGIGLPILAIVLILCGCYFYGPPAFIKEKQRSWRGSPDTVAPKPEEVALTVNK